MSSVQEAPFRGATLVEASAGTGKTYTITTLFVRALLELEIQVQNALIVTYTNAATSELRTRARGRLREAVALLGNEPNDEANEKDPLREHVERATKRFGRGAVRRALREAVLSMDQAAVFTIHGFCQRLLQDYPLLFGIDFDFEIAEDAASALLDIAVDFWAKELHESPEHLVHALGRRGVNPMLLMELATAARMPGAEIIGPPPRPVTDDSVGRWREAHAEASRLWTNEQAVVARLLLESTALNRRRYRTKTIKDEWLPSLDRAMATATYSLPDWFEKLTQSQIIELTKKGMIAPRHPFFDACERLHDADRSLAPGLDHEMFRLKLRFVEYAREAMEARVQTRGLLTYDDLLLRVFEKLDSPQGKEIAERVRIAYPVALVDEFQDTDPLQYAIFRAIYGLEHATVYVGDPKQAIYKFRGADVFSYFEAAKDVGGRKFALQTNHRSDPGLVRAVNTLFSRQQQPFVFDQIGFSPTAAARGETALAFQPPMEILWLTRDDLADGKGNERICALAGNEVAHLLRGDSGIDGRAVRPDDIALLCRKNSEALAVAQALRERDIPASLDGDQSVLGTQMADELEVVLRAALTPADPYAIRRALLSPLLGVESSDLAAIDDSAWTDWISRFRNWHDAWRTQGVACFIEDFLRSSGAEIRTARLPLGRRHLTDLHHLQELLMTAERDRRRDPTALMHWFRRSRDGSGLEGMASEDLQQRPDAHAGAVTVTTIHKSKGLEYGVVLCPFVWEGAWLSSSDKAALRFHDESDPTSLKIDLGSCEIERHLEIAKREALSEATRLLYVALTRAKHRCLFFWGPHRGWGDSALGRLLHGQDRAGNLSDEEIRADLERLCEESEGAIGLRKPHPAPVTQLEPSERSRIEARKVTRSYEQQSRITSFTSLAERERVLLPTVGSHASPQEGRGLFRGLEGGARTGLLLHSILQHADLRDPTNDSNRAVIERELARYGYDREHADEIAQELSVVAQTPLHGRSGAPSLGVLEPERQLRELEFTLSVGNAELAGLAELLRRHRAPEAAPGYHRRLDELASQALGRFIRGFMDLVFEWDGRWYVADYKSSQLPDYSEGAILEVMQEEHYLLQSLLYTAAAQRYLCGRVQGYRARDHWGGSLFLFLRGMQGDGAPGAGVFWDDHSVALLESLDRWIGGTDDP